MYKVRRRQPQVLAQRDVERGDGVCRERRVVVAVAPPRRGGGARPALEAPDSHYELSHVGLRPAEARRELVGALPVAGRGLGRGDELPPQREQRRAPSVDLVLGGIQLRGDAATSVGV